MVSDQAVKAVTDKQPCQPQRGVSRGLRGKRFRFCINDKVNTMGNHPIKNPKMSFFNKFIRLCVLSLMIVLTTVKADKVWADISPPEPPSGTNPIPGSETTNVRMMAETVNINVHANTPYDTGNATVTTTFTMRNLGNGDEQMEVRFPLDQTTTWGKICDSPSPQFSPITDLKVKVNNQSVATQKTYQKITIQTGQEPYSTVTFPCWEHFPVSFPAAKDVTIEVKYTSEPYHAGDASYMYAYVLETGSGWKDTIGSADITVQSPYELTNENYYSCSPADCTVNGNTVKWHYENFEPDFNIGISMLPPPLWQQIVLETKNTTQNPNDGEAWGQLGKAYKEAIMETRGFRVDENGQKMYQRSKEAYQRAVTLLPKDADWHYGFAGLLCWNAEWNNLLVNSNEEAWRECIEQIKATLDINPSHKQTQELIQFFPELNNMIDFSQSPPNYLILTPKPTNTVLPEMTSTPVPTITPTATSLTLAESTETATPVPTITPASTKALTSLPESGSSNLLLYIGAIAILLIATSVFIKFRQV